MFCLQKCAPVNSFTLKVACDDDLRKAFRYATVNMPNGVSCILDERNSQLIFHNQGETPEIIDSYMLTLWKSLLFVPFDTKVNYGN